MCLNFAKKYQHRGVFAKCLDIRHVFSMIKSLSDLILCQEILLCRAIQNPLVRHYTLNIPRKIAAIQTTIWHKRPVYIFLLWYYLYIYSTANILLEDWQCHPCEMTTTKNKFQNESAKTFIHFLFDMQNKRVKNKI